MRYEDMLVETPVRLTEIENRNPTREHDQMNQCSECGVTSSHPWYPFEEIWVIRHWQLVRGNPSYEGAWNWYCEEHIDQRRGRWWKNSHLAPTDLLPPVQHPCANITLGSKCQTPAVEKIDGCWYCAEHASSPRLQQRMKMLLAPDDDDENDAGYDDLEPPAQ
jgi:hypothetical protein